MYVPWSWLKKHIIFPENAKQQTVVRDLTALGLETEIVGESWQFTPLPNRLDLFSWWGVAQEISLLLNYPLNLPIVNQPEFDYNQEANWGKIEMKTNECSQIQLILIQNVKINNSPPWVKDCLTSNNISSINNVVDIANLVMLETGQPLHIYDYDLLPSQEIMVRNSQSGEVMNNLKGQQIILNNGDLVISAKNEIISLAGIVGNESTAINSKTTNILVESAFFSSRSTKKTTQRLNLSTPASKYFSEEYNLPFGNYSLTRLIKLIKEICPDAVEKNVIGWTREPRPKKKTVLVSHGFIEKKLGIKLSLEKIEELLKKCGFLFR